MTFARTLTGLIVSLTCVSGCSPNGSDINDEDISAQWLSSQHDNGIELNGIRANGIRANGIRANGIRANGIRANGIRANGVTLSGVSYNGTSLQANRDDLQITISGSDLNSAEMEGELETGDILNLKVHSVFWSPTAGSYLYNIKYTDDDGVGQWLCGVDGDSNPIAAIPLMKAWILQNGDDVDDPTRFTFSCVNASLGKCQLWGYQVTKQNYQETHNSSTKLRDLSILHQTCQRTVRADYCGNGTSHTRNGKAIDVYDAYGVQNPDNLADFTVEASWRPDGAHCIRHTRWITADSTVTPGESDLQYVQRVCPWRIAGQEHLYPAKNEESCTNDSTSTFYRVNGFGLSNQKQRSLIRNMSIQGN